VVYPTLCKRLEKYYPPKSWNKEFERVTGNLDLQLGHKNCYPNVTFNNKPAHHIRYYETCVWTGTLFQVFNVYSLK